MKKPHDGIKRSQPKKVENRPKKVRINALPSGVRGLDTILGGGIPEFSFNIIAGTRSFSPTRPSRNPRSISPSSANPL
jgi:hypothetical protein